MRNDPQLLIQNLGIPDFRPWKNDSVTRQCDVLTDRCPSLLGRVYTPTLFSRSKALLCCALRVWYRSCSEHGGAAPEKPGQGKFFMCLSGEKIESESTNGQPGRECSEGLGKEMTENTRKRARQAAADSSRDCHLLPPF